MGACYDLLCAEHIEHVFSRGPDLSVLPERGGGVWLPDRIPVECRLLAFPIAYDGLMAPLPELGVGYVVVGVVPHQPTLLFDGKLDRDSRRNLRITVNEEGAFGLQHSQAVGYPLVAPIEVFIPGLDFRAEAEVYALVVRRVGYDNVHR